MTAITQSAPVLRRRFQLRYLAVNIVLCAVFGYLFWRFINWAFLNAVWTATSRSECIAQNRGGACWAGVREWAGALVFGFYPPEQRWRMALLMAFIVCIVTAFFWSRTGVARVLAVGSALMMPAVAIYLAGGQSDFVSKFTAGCGMLSCVLLVVTIVLRTASIFDGPAVQRSSGGLPIAIFLAVAALLAFFILPDLPPVPTQKWGGFSLTALIAFCLVAWGFPLGVILALGRQSRRRLLSITCTGFIETLRALPLVLVLISFSIILPHILPSAGQIDLLLRSALGLLVFVAAYFAEIVRAGLRALPAGQSEAAASLGLTYWQRSLLVMLPQAINLMIPAILVLIANIIKDTALLSVVGLFDLMNITRAVGQDPAWLGTVWEPLLVSGLIYFMCCFGISLLAQRMAPGHPRD